MNFGEFYKEKCEENNYDEATKQCIEKTATHCIKNTFKADEEKNNQPIMMLGKIQSGKTRAFIGLIALAFDNEFDMVFILTKNSTALVQQTETRMKKEFKKAVDSHEIYISDIMKTNGRISGYQLEKKNIIIAKKQQDNLSKVIGFIENEVKGNKKCLIIDDEADTTGIGYNKVKGEEEFTLRTVSRKVNDLRGTLDGCVFVQVTATPYALYLQPEYKETSEIEPIKPMKTILVPYGDEYIGGDYYFVKSKNEKHPARFLFEPVSEIEHELISDQKRKGKKSSMDDRRKFKEEEILTNEDSLKVFKKGLLNFIIGTIVLRETYKNKHYAYVIHTATQKGLHATVQNIIELFFDEIVKRSDQTKKIIEKMFFESYKDIEQSVTEYSTILNFDLKMPEIEIVREKFYEAIDKEYYKINVVNSDNEIPNLLKEDTGELDLVVPFSIFVGGQVLDRGVTIPNMIGFYYGRNPKTMQQDTVLQHSRMFGYRKQFLPVTRFYTTERIHSNMEKITEIDETLREDIEQGKQGEGIYFITRMTQDGIYGKGDIRPCSPDKIKASNILLLKPNKRILPVGFTPTTKNISVKANQEIDLKLNSYSEGKKYYNFVANIDFVEEIINLVYKTIESDKDSYRFISNDEFITSLKYMMKNNDKVNIIVKRNLNISKKKTGGVLNDSPETGSQELKLAKSLAKEIPSIILLQENGLSEDWKNRPFWWPILVGSRKVSKTIYALKEEGGIVRRTKLKE